MASWLKQSTSVDVGIGPFLDETDGKTAETALTITQADIRLKKNAGAWAQKNAAQTLTHEENGWYEVTLDATDTGTLGLLIVAIHESGALPVWKEYMVVPAMMYDSIVAGSDRLDTNVTHVGDTAQTAGDIMADTNDIQTRLPAALVSGRMDASVGAMAANVLTATAINADAITAAKVAADVSAEIADAVWDEDATAHQTGGTFGQAIGDPAADTNTIYGAVVTGAAGATVAADIIAIKTETASILTDTAEIGAAGAGLTAIDLPDQTMNITGNLSGSVGSVTGAVGSVTGAVGSVTGNVGGNVTGTIGGLTAAALKDFFDTDSLTTYASAVAGSVVKEIADNAGGSALTEAGIADAVWDEARAGHVGAGSFGEGVASVTGAVGSVTAAVTVDDTTPVKANVKKINDVTLAGDGAGTPMDHA